MLMYEKPLQLIVLAINEADPIRGKICHKISKELYDLEEPEQALYALRAYPVFLDWLNETETLSDCRGKAIQHMLELLENNSVKEEEESCLPWRKKYKPLVYNIPQELVFHLRPYARFLMWLEEDEDTDDNKLHMNRLDVAATILEFLSVDKVEYDDLRKQLDNVHTNVELLKAYHEEGTTKKQEPAEKDQTRTLNPILDGLSEDDRKLLKRFRWKYQGVALQVFDEYHKYQKQLRESEGFDFDTYPGSFDNMTPIHPVGLYASEFENTDFKKLAELAIAKSAKGKVQFEEVVRVNLRRNWCTVYYYITFLGSYRESLYYYKALVEATLNTVTSEEAYEVLSFSRGPTKVGPSGSVLDKTPEARVEKLVKDKGYNHSAKRVTRASAKLLTQTLESGLKVDKPKAGRATRRSSKSITQVLESKGTKDKVSYDSQCGNSNHSICEKHSNELSILKSFIDMPERELLQKFRETDRSTAAPLIKKFYQYFEQVSESEGFHIGQYPGFFPGVTSIFKPFKWSLWGLGFISREELVGLALQIYNDENASQFVFDSIKEVNVSEDFHYHLYITFLARSGVNVAETFQALVMVNMLLLGDYKVHFVRKPTK